MAEGFTLDVSLNFDKAVRQMADFQKKHGTINVAAGVGAKPGNAAGGIASTEQATETRKMAQTVRVTTNLFRQLNTALATFTNTLSKAGAGAALAMRAPAVAPAGGALANVGKAGAIAMQVPGWAMLAQMAAAPITKVWGAGKNYINMARTQSRNELSVLGVLQNSGLGAADFERIKGHAASLQNRTIYGDEAMIAAAGRLATVAKGSDGRVDTEQLMRLMNLLADYASGKGNNAALNSEALTSMALDLGRVLEGQYRTMKENGFDTRELEALRSIESKGGTVTTEQKVSAMERAFSAWSGRAERFAGTEEGREIQMKNRLGDVEEAVGKRIMPAYEKLTSTMNQSLPALESMKTAVGDLFILAANGAVDVLPTLAEALKGASAAVSEFTKDGEAVDSTLRTAGGAMAMIVGLKFGAEMQKMAAQMRLAVGEINGFRSGINALGKTALVQGGLFIACSWALGKIGQAAKLLLELIGLEGDNAARQSEARMIQDNLKWSNAYQKDMNNASKGMTEAELMRVQSLPGLPFNPDNPSSFDMRALPNGLNQRQIDYLKAKGGRDYFRGKANENMKRMNAIGSKGRGDDRADYDKAVQDALALGGKLNMNVTNNNTSIKQENHIDAGFDEIGKLIKENLQEILVSRLNFRADVESMKAVAL